LLLLEQELEKYLFPEKAVKVAVGEWEN